MFQILVKPPITPFSPHPADSNPEIILEKCPLYPLQLDILDIERKKAQPSGLRLLFWGTLRDR
jgi:hypothetical protein